MCMSTYLLAIPAVLQARALARLYALNNDFHLKHTLKADFLMTPYLTIEKNGNQFQWSTIIGMKLALGGVRESESRI